MEQHLERKEKAIGHDLSLNKTGLGNTGNAMPALLSPSLGQARCQRNRRNWELTEGQKFPLQGAGSALCWSKHRRETLKGLKTLKSHKSATRGVKVTNNTAMCLPQTELLASLFSNSKKML